MHREFPYVISVIILYLCLKELSARAISSAIRNPIVNTIRINKINPSNNITSSLIRSRFILIICLWNICMLMYVLWKPTVYYRPGKGKSALFLMFPVPSSPVWTRRYLVCRGWRCRAMVRRSSSRGAAIINTDTDTELWSLKAMKILWSSGKGIGKG